MTNVAVLGNQWGDEGKGHITHYLSRDYDWVIRFNGGANAGHTIHKELFPGQKPLKLVRNLLPSLDFFWIDPKTRKSKGKCFLASGMVIDLEKLKEEVLALEDISVVTLGRPYGEIAKRIYVDPDAFVVLPEHKEEDKNNNGHIGSTNRGIGPAYKAKISRTGTRVKRMLDIGHESAKALQDIGVQFKHVMELEQEFKHSNLLFEGAQGTMLDINHGIYPYVSCSDCTIGGIISSGFAFAKLDNVYGVAKCYTTKVGEGPFPTEILGAEAEILREKGQEFGATTGRPRRIGWLDLPALRYAVKKSGITSIIMTKFDILDGMDNVKICVTYGKDPVCPKDFFDAIPQYIQVPGWKDCKDATALFTFLSMVERATECPVEYISCGTKSEDIRHIIW